MRHVKGEMTMFKHKIELITTSDIVAFVNTVTGLPGSIKLMDGSGFCVNGKSLLGAWRRLNGTPSTAFPSRIFTRRLKNTAWMRSAAKATNKAVKRAGVSRLFSCKKLFFAQGGENFPLKQLLCGAKLPCPIRHIHSHSFRRDASPRPT